MTVVCRKENGLSMLLALFVVLVAPFDFSTHFPEIHVINEMYNRITETRKATKKRKNYEDRDEQ